jgi:hypothetical protein
MGAIFFDEIEKGIFPDGGDKVLLDEVVNPLIFFTEFLINGFLFFLGFGGSEEPIKHDRLY